MKGTTTVISLALLGALAPFQSPDPHPARITVHVVDDEGRPIPNVTVNTSTFDHMEPGQGFGNAINLLRNANTDPQGFAAIEMPCRSGRIAYGMAPNPNYYYDHGRRYHMQSLQDGRWTPWNPTLEIVFKPIRNPIPMFVRQVGSYQTNRSLKPDEQAGFDLVEGDYLPPLGRGKTADIIFHIRGHLHPRSDWRSELTVTFPRPGDGIVRFGDWTPLVGSALRSPRMAADQGYEPRLVTTFERKPGEIYRVEKAPENNLACYFIRVRSEPDADGNVRSALYGKITAAFNHRPFGKEPLFNLEFTYYLNPTPNDRNVEFDPKRNLFGELPHWEHVSAP